MHAKPFAQGVGWQDFLAKHMTNRGISRRVRMYLTSQAAVEDVPIIRRVAECTFRLLQGIQHPGVSQALDLIEYQLGLVVVFNHDPDFVCLDQWLLHHEAAVYVDDLTSAYAAVVNTGHARSSAPADGVRSGMRFAFIKDPEGNLLELVQPPDERHISRPVLGTEGGR